MSTPEEIKAEYTSSLADLNVNSKPLINVLTILAEENLPNAKIIVEAIEEHLAKVTTDVKLPILYLIDCISKNVGQTYTNLFSQNMVSTFCNVFKMADEKTRSEMFKLRQTWNHIFPEMKLYAIDVQINQIDPAWPVMARPAVKHNSIHFNPRFLLNNSTSSTTPAGTTETPKAATANPAVGGVQTTPDMETLLMQEQIIKKQKELIEVTKRALEVKVLQTQVKLHEQMLASKIAAAANNNILLKPEVAKQLMPEGITKIKSSLNTNNLSKLQNSQSRINPVNAALLAATRPASRDPRLLKQQLKAVTVSSDVSASTNVSTQKSAAVDNNKDIPTKNSVRDNNIPKDPRLTKVDRKSKGNKSEKSRNSDISSSNSSLTSSSGCLDSPIKNSKRSPTKSKKREKSDSKRSQDYDSGFSKREKYSSKEENHHHHHSESGKDSNNDSSNFKSVKNKNRNYMRRNLNDSPVQQNEDFRSLEQSRANVTEAVKHKSSVESLENKHMDVDLRQIAPAINKKRSSTEASDQVTKKSRSFDVLFGSEDTDLRQLMQQESDTKRSVVERPPTPPPPIISVERNVENLPKKSDLDAVRAKLANATNRDKVLNKSFHKNKLQQQKGDQDLRSQVPSNVTISPEEEKVIQSGHMTNEQGKQMLTKIISQFEKDKLREAKRKDREDGFNDFILNTTSPKEDSENNESSTKFVFNDKDERLNIRPPPLMETPTLDNQQLFNTRDRRSQFRGVGRDAWRGSRGGRGAIVVGLQPRPPMRGWQHQQQQGRWRGPYNTMRNSESMQTLDDESSKSPNQDFGFELTIDQEANKTLNIDGIPRDIRVYNDVAVIFMNYDDPREISFQNGARRVIFNNKESYLLQFGQDYTEFLVNGIPLRMKLGVPSREVFINDIGYECYFGGPPIHITVNGVTLTVNLDGPPPQVKIAEEKRTDLVVGKINLIINATLMIPVFLDGKIQKFMVDSESCTLQFVDALKKVLINDVPFNVEFGGLPKPFVIHGKKHFIRFSVLPKGVKPGFVKINEMEGENGTSPLRDNDDGDKHCTALEMEPLRPEPQSKSKDIEDSSNGSKSPNFMNILPSLNNFDALSNVFSQSFASSSTGTGGYQVELPGLESAVPTDNENKPSIPTSIKPILMNANINELFQQLVASGIVKTQEKPVLDSNIIATCTESTPFLNSNENQQKNDIVTENAKPQRKSLATILKMLSFKKPETLKVRQAALYSNLYTGMQCSSCGMRFPPEASMWYSQHLDWHFRQNRKGKKNARIASSRKWYYSLTDWKNYEELEDLEEREKNYFDQQQQQAEVAEEAEDETEIPTVPASSDTTDERCSVCRDVFEQFFNEDKEEWHLRNAIKMDDKTYHPVCYEDHQKSIHDSSLMDDSKVEENNQTKIIPGLEIVLDDDDEIAVNADNDVISLLIDDEKEMKTAKDILSLTEEDKDIEDPVEKHDDEDDDVILNEVAPIKIIVDDDDDDDDDEHEPNEARQEIEQQIHIKMETKSEFDDGFVDVGEIVTLKDVGQVKIKSEPIDNEYPMETPMNTTSSEEVESNENISRNKEVDIEIKDIESPQITIPATTHAELITASMDGNMELVSNPPLAVTQTINIGSKIKINISKPLPVITPREMNDIGDNSNELSKMYNEPSVEELEIVNYKTALKNVPLRKLPPVQKGSELTGLCSIM